MIFSKLRFRSDIGNSQKKTAEAVFRFGTPTKECAFGLKLMRQDIGVLLFGAGNRNRTYDLIITNDALYQLSYPGVVRNFKALAGVGQFKTSIHQHQTQFLG